MINKIGLSDAVDLLRQSGEEFKVLFETGSLSIELYKPHEIDKQQPHDRDEIYLIATGKAKFCLEEKITEVSSGDFLFVPAGARHQFIDFTADFTTWVLFFGPKGGEKGKIFNFCP